MTDPIRDLTDREPIAPLPEPRERRRLRLAFGVTQSQLADALSVTRRMVINYEKGAVPHGETRTEYAAILAAWAETEKQTNPNA